jgi:integrase
VKISRATLKSLKPVIKATWVFDSTLPGFGLKQQPSGKASYVVSFRIRGSRTKRTVTLGPITTLSPEQARERARLVITAAREGRDLNMEGRERAQKLDAERRALGDRVTVSSAAGGFLADMGRFDSPHTGRPATATSVTATRARLRRLVERHGDCAIADLDREDVEAVLAATPVKSRRNVFGAITRLLTWAKRKGHLTTVVTTDLARPAMPAPRTRTPTSEEIRRLLEAADQLVAVGRWAPVQRDGLFVLLMSGQRRGEIASMDWADLDLSRSLWSQPAIKNKAKRPHVIPLSARVTALLQARWERDGKPKVGLVLRPMRGGSSIYADLGERAKSLRIATGIAFSLHDARRAMTSACAERSVSFEVLDTLLNHAAAISRGGLRSVYNRASLIEQMRQAVEVWDGAVFGTVIPMRRPA